MILYTYLPEQESALEPLLDLLLNDPAVLLHSFDLPVPGAKLERLGVLARAVIGTGLDQHPRFTQLVTYLEGQQAEMLTFLDWLELNLALWRRQAAHLITDPAQRAFFQATVARVQRLQRAVANGHATFRAETQFATDLLAELLREAPQWLPLAEALCNILESVVRTSCAVEAVNSVLRPYLTIKRSF